MSLTMLLIIGGGLVLILLVVGIVISATSERTLVEERLGRYLAEGEAEKAAKEAKPSALTDWVNKQIEKSSYGERIARELARADLKFKPGEYIALIIITTIGGTAIAWLAGGRHPVSALIGVAVGLVLPRMYVKRQQAQRMQRFDEQLPDMLNLIVNGLRAGYSTMQAMEAISRELPSPICDEFRRVVQEMQLGIPMERSLANLLRRIPSGDLDFVITAINVQREVGGNLAEILDVISFTIRERIRIKGEIRVLTSQVMYSGRALALLPMVLVVLLWFINREYMMEFFNPARVLCGVIALSAAGMLIGIGYFVMTRIAKIEV